MKLSQLASIIQAAHEALQQNAVRAVNQNITARNWLVGCWIVEFEQKGEDRAKYGEKLLFELAKSVNIKGLGSTMLSQCRKFYLVYPQIGSAVDCFLQKPQNYYILQTLSEKFQLTDDHRDAIFQSLSEKSISIDLPVSNVGEQTIPVVSGDNVFNYLSFSHIMELLSIENSMKRTFYEIEAIKGCWSVRELHRQINSLCYERVGFSEDPEKMVAFINKNAEVTTPVSIVKSPYVFDFLGLSNAAVIEESDLESMLLSHIQDFILELGNGFCFEARQKRILIDNEYFFVDLVFYHRVLKCHVLVELKTRKFDYVDIAQLNMYVTYYRENMMNENDNPPIGILLCTDVSTEMVKYATAGMDENLFVSKYLLQLPPKETFIKFMNDELEKL